MGRATAVLTWRTAAFLALAACLGCYYAWSASLWNGSLWSDVAFVALVLTPAAFALVYLVLPARSWTDAVLLGSAGALALLTWGLEEADQAAVADFSKLAAATLVGFWFVSMFESLLLVVLVALVIPFVDAYSVWRGPTSSIVSKHPHVFTTLSFALPIPGEHNAARLGPPDLLFFALFLAAAARFELRVFWTWLALALSFGATLAIAVASNIDGLPALPGLSIAFLAVNGDLLWKQRREMRLVQ